MLMCYAACCAQTRAPLRMVAIKYTIPHKSQASFPPAVLSKSENTNSRAVEGGFTTLNP